MNVAPRPPQHLIEVCSGVGMLGEGVRRACGAQVVAHVERDAYAAACLAARMEEADLESAPIWDDIATFNATRWRGLVDGVIGGTPCQDLSLAGNRRGLDGERSRLFFEHVRIAVECEAPFLFWENVAGATRVIPRVCEYLEERGYRGAWTVVRASDVGAPHERARIFLLACSESFAKREPHNALSAHARQRARGDAGGGGMRLGPGEPLAHGERQGLEERGALRGDGGAERSATERGRMDLGPYPPGRADLEGWARVLAVRPDLAPALPQPRLRGVADGLGGWVDTDARSDRLRLTGNGVVPEQAAHAWRGLWRALFGG